MHERSRVLDKPLRPDIDLMPDPVQDLNIQLWPGSAAAAAGSVNAGEGVSRQGQHGNDQDGRPGRGGRFFMSEPGAPLVGRRNSPSPEP